MIKRNKVKLDNIEKGVFLVSLIGIVFDTKNRKILIGKRKNDPYIPELKWCFPGGRPEYGEDLERALEKEIEKRTGLKVKNLGAVFSRAPKENEKFLLIYYLCEVIGGKEKPGENFFELKWVKPEELEDYFTTSFDPRLKEYIINLK